MAITENRPEHDRLLVEGLEDAVILLDGEGRILLWPPSAERVLGYAPSDVVGTFATSVLQLASGPASEGWERRKDGSRFWAGTVTRIVKSGTRSFTVLTIRDASARRIADEASIARTLDLERSNRELDEFAALASHDLQEPLRKIRAFGERLRMRLGDRLDETSADYMGRIEESAKRMQRLLEDLLEYARLATLKEPFSKVSLKAIASHVLVDLEARIDAEKAVIEIGDLPEVHGGVVQLRQLFQNLIANALKFHAPGKPPVLRITSTYSAPAPGLGGAWAINFADEGIGFAEMHVERIFGMFQRLHGRSEFEGNGMGLSICRRIAAQHGGGITARSTPGKGTTFIVTLPETTSSERGSA